MKMKVVDGRRRLGPARFGIIVAGDAPERFAERILSGDCEPVTLHFHDKSGEGFDVPVRNLTPVEVILVVNRALSEGVIEFGFQPKGPQAPIIGGM